MNKCLFSKVISVLFALLLCVNVIPMSAFAHEPVYYPYMLYAHSGDDDSICIESNGLCANGTIATNGAVVNSSPYTNGNLSIVEDSSLSMVHAHYAILNNYFEGAVLYTNDVVFNEMNNNISGKFGTDFSISAIGSTSLSGNIGAIYDITFSKSEYDSNFNASNSVIYSRMGNVTFECSNFSFGGLIFAPRGTVTINADNVNVNGIILAKKIVITGSNVNLNYNQQYADIIGEAINNTSESIENDTIFETEKKIIVDTTHLGYCEDGYILKDGFEELNGKLMMSSMFETLTVNIYDDLGINVFSQTLTPSQIWSTIDIGLLYGDNYVEITATESNGNVTENAFIIHCHTADFNDNLTIDRGDPDGDELINYIENYFGTDINNPDTDDDGLTDFQEIYDASTEPLLWDTDEDGICDGDEDNDNDGLANANEYQIGCYLYAADSDMDGLNDYDEYMIYHTAPMLVDTDEDTLTDAEELEFGTDPLLYDTNGNNISDANEHFTTIFDVTEMGIPYDFNVVSSLCFTSDVKNTLSVEIETYSSDVFINPNMIGYIGSAYTFTSDQPFDEATMTFTLNEDFFEDEDFVPAIYYFDEENQVLEKLPNQVISKNTVSAAVEHFSTYIVLNSRKLEEVWEQDIDISKNNNVEIVFILDYSTSLDSNDPYGYRVSVAQDFIDRLNPEDKVGVVVFNHGYIYQPLTNDFQAAKNTLQTAKSTAGGTYLWNGVKAGLNLFEAEKPDEVQRYIILMSDGWSSDCSDYSDIQTEYEQLLDDKQIDKVFTIGLAASGCNSDLLESMATNSGDFYKLSTASSANSFFTNTYDKIDEEIEEERDWSEDSNNDGITDNDTLLMCKGYITTGTGQYVFGNPDGEWEDLFDDIQGNDDFDGDGLKNGDEVYITRMSTGQPIVIYNSDPTDDDSDSDTYTDYNEIYKFGTSPLIPEVIVYDFDTDSLLNNYFMSDEYYEQITGNLAQKAAIGIGNFAYDGKTSLTTLYFEVLVDYLQETGIQTLKSEQTSAELEAIADLDDVVDYSLNCLWNAVKSSKITDQFDYIYFKKEFTDDILPLYNKLKEAEKDIRNSIKNADVADEALVQNYFNELSKYLDCIDDMDNKYNMDIVKKFDDMSNSKLMKRLGNVATALDAINTFTNLYSAWNSYSDLAGTVQNTENAVTILDTISSNTEDPTLKMVANDMSAAIQGSLETIDQIKETGLAISGDLIQGGLELVAGKLLTVFCETPVTFAVAAGYTLGTVGGSLISPVGHRSEYAIRVCVSTIIAKIMADEAAHVTRGDNIQYHLTLGHQIGVLKIKSVEGKQMHSLYLGAVTARIFAENQLIELLNADEGNWVQKNMNETINWLVGLFSGDEYSTNASDIIDQCEMTISAMNGILGKYQYK